MVLKKLDLKKDALEVLLEAVRTEPLHWGSWLELASLCTDKEMVSYHWLAAAFSVLQKRQQLVFTPTTSVSIGGYFC